MKKIFLSLIIMGLFFTHLSAQTTAEEYFYISFDVDSATMTAYRKKVVEMAPDSKFAQYVNGWLKTKEGKFNEAIVIADLLIKNNPDFVYGYLLKGNSLYYKEDYTAAIMQYNKVIELNPREIGGFHNRGLCKYYLEDYRGAIKDYNAALEINPNFPNTYFRRGMAKIKLGRIDDGCLDLSKAGELGFVQAYDEIRKNCK